MFTNPELIVASPQQVITSQKLVVVSLEQVTVNPELILACPKQVVTSLEQVVIRKDVKKLVEPSMPL